MTGQATRSWILFGAALVGACHLKVRGLSTGAGPEGGGDGTTAPTEGDEPKPAARSHAVRMEEPGDQTPHATVGRLARNPARLESDVGKTTVFLASEGVETCFGYVDGRPAAVLDVPQGAKGAVVTAPTAGILLVKSGGRYVCAESTPVVAPSVSLDELPPGRHVVYVGSSRENHWVARVVDVEETAKPRDRAWLGSARPREVSSLAETLRLTLDVETVAGPPETIDVPQANGQTRRTKVARPKVAHSCADGFAWTEAAQATLKVTQRLPQATLAIRSPRAVRVGLFGPIPDHGRNVPVVGCAAGEWSVGRLEPGVYAIKLATDQPGVQASATAVLRAEKVARRSSVPIAKIPEQIPLADRDLVWWFPELVRSDVVGSDELRAELFRKAPRSLFVFAREDLDAETATAVIGFGQVASRIYFDEKPAIGYPSADEPLLRVEGRLYLAADGSLFEIQERALAAAPSGKARPPAAVRNGDLIWDEAVSTAGKPKPPKLAAFEKVSDAYGRCADKIWAPVDRQVAKLQDLRPSAERDAEIARTRNAARAREEDTCNRTKRDAAETAAWKELLELRAARRKKDLDKNVAHLRALFPR